MAQMRVIPGNKTANLDRAAALIEAAARKGAHLVLLPEALNLGWTDPSARHASDPIPSGESYETLAAAARRRRVFVCAGLVEKTGTAIYNSAVLIGPRGGLLLRHRKIYELAIAHDLYAAGDRLEVVETPLGRLGIMICADAFAPGQVISRALGLMGAEVILSPCAWAVPPDHDNVKEPYGRLWLDHYVPVAKAFSLWIIGVSGVGRISAGPWRGRHCIGCSMAIDPEGNRVARGAYGVEAEDLIFLRVTPRPARRCESGE